MYATTRTIRCTNGLVYRGPISCTSPKTPWRITFAGNGRSWRTAEKFETLEACNAYLDGIATALSASSAVKSPVAS